MEIAIRTEQLSKTFRVGFWARKVKAVEDLSFQVRSGEIFGLLGPNGAGKTTTIKMLLSFVRPSRGRASIAGHAAGSLAARKAVGYLPENPALYEFLTGEGYDVRICSQGDQAFAVVQTLLPDLIILDVRMAEVNGLGVLYLLSMDERTRQIVPAASSVIYSDPSGPTATPTGRCLGPAGSSFQKPSANVS